MRAVYRMLATLYTAGAFKVWLGVVLATSATMAIVFTIAPIESFANAPLFAPLLALPHMLCNLIVTVCTVILVWRLTVVADSKHWALVPRAQVTFLSALLLHTILFSAFDATAVTYVQVLRCSLQIAPIDVCYGYAGVGIYFVEDFLNFTFISFAIWIPYRFGWRVTSVIVAILVGLADNRLRSVHTAFTWVFFNPIKISLPLWVILFAIEQYASKRPYRRRAIKPLSLWPAITNVVRQSSSLQMFGESYSVLRLFAAVVAVNAALHLLVAVRPTWSMWVTAMVPVLGFVLVNNTSQRCRDNSRRLWLTHDCNRFQLFISIERQLLTRAAIATTLSAVSLAMLSVRFPNAQIENLLAISVETAIICVMGIYLGLMNATANHTTRIKAATIAGFLQALVVLSLAYAEPDKDTIAYQFIAIVILAVIMRFIARHQWQSLDWRMSLARTGARSSIQ